LGGVVALPGAVEQMRATGDDSEFVQVVIAWTRVAFESLQSDGHDGLLIVEAA
jgi:hypothetical protein